GPQEHPDRTAVLVQANVPILEGADWTKEYFNDTLRELAQVSVNPPGGRPASADLIAWPESPAPFYVYDPAFHMAVSEVAQKTNAWVLAGSLGTNSGHGVSAANSATFNSGSLFSPDGQPSARYDKVHLVPFGEYVPFRSVFSFAAGL